MAETVDLGELIGRVVSLCEGAADLIREAYRGGGDLQTRFKDGVSDPVTIADLRAQRYVHGSLEAAYPALTLIGEEDDATVAHLTDVALADGSDSATASLDLGIACGRSRLRNHKVRRRRG